MASLTAEVARLKGEVQREKTKAEKLQHVLKSRSTQQQATVEKRTATCDQWEQKLASESETLRKEKEAAAHTKALYEKHPTPIPTTPHMFWIRSALLF